MIATVEIGYSANSLVKKLDRESYGRLRTEAEVLQLEEWDEGKNDQPYWSVYGSRVLAMVPQDTMVLDKWGIEYRIVKFRNTYRVEDPDTGATTGSMTWGEIIEVAAETETQMAEPADEEKEPCPHEPALTPRPPPLLTSKSKPARPRSADGRT